MGKVSLYYNCMLFRDGHFIKDDLWTQDGKFIDPVCVEYTADDHIDCGGALIVPGFIDTKMNGGFGVDFSCLVEQIVENVAAVSKRLPETGVTSFCPTIITSAADVYKRVVPQICPKPGSADTGAGVIGVHLDGPFINKERKGAHPEEFIRSFERGFDSIKDLCDLENVAIITLAPELDNAMEVISNLTRWGIRVSLGHSATPLSTAEAAVKKGATMITHLFNAMPSFHHRDPSLVGLLASDDVPKTKTIYYGLIADGNHTHPAALRMAVKMAPSSLMLVTDGTAALGLSSGTYNLGSCDVEVDRAALRSTLKGSDVLAGSIAPMDVCLRNFIKFTGVSTADALKAVSEHPAKALGLYGKKGTLAFGADADFVLLEPETLKVMGTFIAGREAFSTRK